MMTDSEQIHALMTEIGPAMELAEVTQGSDSGPWALGHRDGVVIYVEQGPEAGRLWLSADIGAPHAADRSRLYELMLLYNAQWQQTDGARIGLDMPEGRCVLAFDIALSGLDLPRLQTLLGNFRHTLDGWRRIAAGDPKPVPDFPTMPAPGVIRG